MPASTRQELAHRRQLGYPPFSRLVALRFSHRDAHRCRAEAERLGRWLAAEIRRLGLAGRPDRPGPLLFQPRRRAAIAGRSSSARRSDPAAARCGLAQGMAGRRGPGQPVVTLLSGSSQVAYCQIRQNGV